MSAWLYQMSAARWSPERYREEVWEGELVSWPTRKIVGRAKPAGGDSLFLWYTATGAKEPGLYGWGVVLSYAPLVADPFVRWRPAFPSDYLKMFPLFDDDLTSIISGIRGKMPQATMWSVPQKSAKLLSERLREHMSGIA